MKRARSRCAEPGSSPRHRNHLRTLLTDRFPTKIPLTRQRDQTGPRRPLLDAPQGTCVHLQRPARLVAIDEDINESSRLYTAMKPFIRHSIVIVAVWAVLSACQDFEQIRLRDQGPSPAEDHCLSCMDIGEAWALFRMGEYDQVEAQCALVIDSPVAPRDLHIRRARDIAALAKGFLSVRRGDWPTARACFDRIGDPQLRELGQPYFEPDYDTRARVLRMRDQGSRSLART